MSSKDDAPSKFPAMRLFIDRHPEHARDPTPGGAPCPAKRQAALDTQAERIKRESGGMYGWHRDDDDYLQQRYDCSLTNLARQLPLPSYEPGGKTKLTADEVLKIRRLHGLKRSWLSIAREFDISDKTVADIMRRRTWKHI